MIPSVSPFFGLLPESRSTDREELVRRALQIVNLTRWQDDNFYVEAFLSSGEYVTYNDLIRRGPLMEKSELKAIGVRTNTKLSRAFWATLTNDGRQEYGEAARRISFAVNAALRNSADLQETIERFGEGFPVELYGGDERCAASRAFGGAMAAGDAVDLPLSGCDAVCMCRFAIAGVDRPEPTDGARELPKFMNALFKPKG